MARQSIPTSGLWSVLAALFNANFSDVYQARRFGVYNYDDLDTKTTPISIAAADTWYALTNDDAGPSAFTYPTNGVADVWDTVTQAFDFSGFENGDFFSIRVDVEITSTTANQDFDLSLFLADDTGTPIEIPFIVKQSFKAAGSRKILRYNGVAIGSDLTRLNEARFKIRSSATGSVVVNGWLVKAEPAAYEVA